MPERTGIVTFKGGPLTLLGPELKVGDTAPDFELLGSDGRTWRLRDLLGESGRDGVVLAWFPKAFTPG